MNSLIADARELPDEGALVLLEASSNKWGEFRNHLRMGKNGETVWQAELPKPGGTTASYAQTVSVEPIVADSFSSNRCTIDLATGEVMSVEFYK